MSSTTRDMAGLISRYLHESAPPRVDLLAWNRYSTARDRFDEPVRLCADLAAALRTDRVDLVVLNDAPPHLARRIVTTGERVFCSDPEQDHAFVRDVQLRAADLNPFLRRTRRLKLAAVRR